jgi:CelD/BcsL family acetyltransferase involved in cellulose biosynthesis
VRLAKEGAGHRAIRGPALASSLTTLRELHWSQWGGRSQFLPAFDRFAAACVAGAAVDEVAVHELHTDARVIASVVTFEVAGRVSLYQSGRLTDPRWKDATTALLATIVDDACNRGFAEVDFLRGEEDYKGRFTTTRRGMDRLVAGSGVSGRLRQAGAAAKLRTTRAAVSVVRAGRSVTRRRS